MPQTIDLSQVQIAPAEKAGESLTGQRTLIKKVKEVIEDQSEFYRCVYLLSQFVRCGFDKGYDKVTSSPELLRTEVLERLPRRGYSRTARDAAIWVNPDTREDGWVMELADGKSIWGGPFIVAGHPEGSASRDLHSIMADAKQAVVSEYFGVIKHCNGVLTDQLALRYKSPWFELKKEICHRPDVDVFFKNHPELVNFFAALFSFLPQSSENQRQ